MSDLSSFRMFEDNEIDLIKKLLQDGAVRFNEEQVDSLDDWEERHWRFLMLKLSYCLGFLSPGWGHSS
jgi:hypothetical protein